uniref:Farnesyl diphosphate synthase n=1 Tax=Chromera velia CCMP2878 TaxID=1169474 RepID=A0A0G4FY38_9ALVE|eukprot:Cvel_19328.t1-p1 / transcript=Cvel_19328.t1 / gene=Cvel_19328 / organism=Chromera_velia_CCMP2878 / gene_product=Farnesyl pyrophosphate synthase, putative / transcript_product=Farnesyl pyrophosphate synthase, putative / location=Cvel_scaffold1658:35317-39832(+) / protein_length=538 / sequence_SO=supercontig / SO=protein_coding / is_pseudo=false
MNGAGYYSTQHQANGGTPSAVSFLKPQSQAPAFPPSASGSAGMSAHAIPGFPSALPSSGHPAPYYSLPHYPHFLYQNLPHPHVTNPKLNQGGAPLSYIPQPTTTRVHPTPLHPYAHIHAHPWAFPPVPSSLGPSPPYSITPSVSPPKQNGSHAHANGHTSPAEEGKRPEMTLESFSLLYDDVEAVCLESLNFVPPKGTQPEIGEDILEELRDYYKALLDHTVKGGKMTRGLTVVKAAVAAAPHASSVTPDFLQKAALLGWCVELLQAFFLVSDDVMDQSLTRRGLPCWYRVPGVTEANAINDAFFLECSIYRILNRFFGCSPSYARLLETILQSTFVTVIGQHLDTNAQKRREKGESEDLSDEERVDLSRLSESRYRSIVRCKTAHYSFYLPCALGMIFGSDGAVTAEQLDRVRAVCGLIGELFQVQDDVLDCFGKPEEIGKVGTDIEENKCSWLAVRAVKKGTEEDKAVLQKGLGRKEPETVAEVKAVYTKMGLKEDFEEEEEKTAKEIEVQIARVSNEGVREVLCFLLNKIYRRKK